MIKPRGSWVAIPTPFTNHGKIDFGGFKTLIDFHAAHKTTMLLVMGSAGEVTLLSYEERKAIVTKVAAYAKGKIPVFFGGSLPTTEQTVEFAKFAEAEGADGLIFTAPPYLMLTQTAVYEYLRAAMGSVTIPVGIYNNPTRVVVNINPETIEKLSHEFNHFVADKEAVSSVQQLAEVRRRVGDALSILCCDYPKYSILLPTLALGGDGAANIGGNIIPEETAEMAEPWESIEQLERSRELFFHYYPLISMLYTFSNPVMIKPALDYLGLPGGKLRAPNPNLEGEKLRELHNIIDEFDLRNKYGVR
ncbi:MAG: dihydrodipicolinate synthase family protein [Spirochaetota bacterium]